MLAFQRELKGIFKGNCIYSFTNELKDRIFKYAFERQRAVFKWILNSSESIKGESKTVMPLNKCFLGESLVFLFLFIDAEDF